MGRYDNSLACFSYLVTMAANGGVFVCPGCARRRSPATKKTKQLVCVVNKEFLRMQYGDENLSFWLAVEEYRLMSDTDSRNETARMIYEDYVSTLSPTEISLDAKIRASVDKEMSDPDENTFQLAQQHIFDLMYRDCFPRFLKSKCYKHLLKK
ncbi:hypothetical protein QZH41_020754 [Actinostola sp. cb2023]|nr:hypothetical protein QZH41_020754 [Actinostola sp. cb2023]